jgi:hypothetical protein
MSVQVTPFMIPWARLTRVFGSRDTGLVGTVLQNQRVAARAYYPDEDEKGEEPPTYRDALQAIVDGGPFQTGFPEVYVSAVGLICASLGERMEELQLSAEDASLLVLAETALQERGAAGRFSIAALLRRGAPFAIPQPEGLPALGFLTPDEVEAAIQCYRSLDLAAVPPAVRAVIDHIGAWLGTASEAGEAIVCLYE